MQDWKDQFFHALSWVGAIIGAITLDKVVLISTLILTWIQIFIFAKRWWRMRREN